MSAFGLNPADGGVLLANHITGTIDRLVFADPVNAPVPRTLRELNAFADLQTLTPNTNVVPFEVINPLWSDGALKQRWVDLSRIQGRVGFDDSDAWTFPAGAVRMTSLGTPTVSGSMGFWAAVALEALFTFFLVSAVYGTVVSSQGQRVAGFAIGLVVLVCALGGGGALTGAVMNPARAFGPALVAWDWHAQAVYWIGPLVGAAAAAGLWRYLLLPPGTTDLR